MKKVCVVGWSRLLGAVMTLIMALGCGCRVVHTATRLPARVVRTAGGAEQNSGGFDPVILQQRLMRFADDYASRLVVALDSLPSPTNSAAATFLLRTKLNCVNSVFTIATGPNELMNLADMFVMVTLTRALVEEQGLPGVYGQSARPMIEACRHGETNITAIALTVISPEQLNELRAAIAQWRQENPDLRSALFIRALGLEVEIAAQAENTTASGGSLFRLLRLDPLAGLDPAARELAAARLFAERALFLSYRKPTLLRWQAELFILEAAATPPLREAGTNATKVAGALERAGKTVEQLPALVRSEREAILNALPSQEPALTNLAAQLTAILGAGTRMSDSLNATLTTARGIQTTAAESAMRREGSAAAPKPSGIEAYTESARHVELAALQLTELLRTLNQTLDPTNLARLSAQVTPVVQQAQDGGRAVAGYVFRRAILLVVFTCVAVLVTALVFQWIRKRTTGK